jgi:hypothetical protein
MLGLGSSVDVVVIMDCRSGWRRLQSTSISCILVEGGDVDLLDM